MVFSPWLWNYELLHVFQEFELRSKWEIRRMALLIFLDQNQYYTWTLKKRKMIPPHPIFWWDSFGLLQLCSFPQWISLSLLLYPLWTFGPRLVFEILPTPIVDSSLRVVGIHVNNSIKIPSVVDVLLAYPEGHVFWMILPWTYRRIAHWLLLCPIWSSLSCKLM